ncbi:hypothetical protein ABQD92_05860 [Enterococcus avium]|jgi:uncharacterized membrane protein|uniref:hypothetical protein n=1 Tax=Enterococcus avium TaxID=33945 RepID=UPI0032E47125
MNDLVKILKDTKKHLMTGVSYMIPFVVTGGVILAVSVLLSGETAVPDAGALGKIAQIGVAGLGLRYLFCPDLLLFQLVIVLLWRRELLEGILRTVSVLVLLAD